MMRSEQGECPLVPMGAVTGKPSRELIRETLAAFREAGFTQYLIYPRSGCELEYMSREWFDTCRCFLEEGKKLSFTSFWLYDEFNWPSGGCNGAVMAAKKEFGAPYLIVLEKDGAYSVRKDYNPERPNVLDPEAVRLFIRLTHERYAEEFGPELGTLIKGIFTDEPSFQYIWGSRGAEEGEKLRIPWYSGLDEEYRTRTGRELVDDILYCLKNNCTRYYEPVLYELLGDRFRRSFFEPIRAWCEAHGILHTGHLMSEVSPASSIRASGKPLDIIDSLSMPGMDEIFTRQYLDDMEWVTLGTVEHGIRTNGNGGLAELFALGPCDMSLERMRKMIRIVSMFGVDHYILAVTQLDVRGNVGKPFYFNPYNRVQPWFSSLRELGADAVHSAGIARKTFAPEIQIRYPGIHAPLNELLKGLTSSQRLWSLISEQETGRAPCVLRFDEDVIREEKSEKYFSTLADLLRWLDSTFPQETRIENPDGSRAGDLFFRTYADSSAEVVNLSREKEPRELYFRRNGQRVRFTLSFNSVFSFPAWRVTPSSPLLKRAEFRNGRFEFTVKEPLDGVSFAFRNYGDKVSLKLDGQTLSSAGESVTLPPGYRELYLESAPQALSAGTHLLELAEEAKDYPYLPSALICGHFAAEGSELRSYAGDGKGLDSYIGILTQETELNVPADVVMIHLETDGLPTELFLNGESMGKRTWSPFAWRIPESLSGRRVSIRIVKETSCGPLFGTEAFRTEEFGHWRQYAPDNENPLPHRISEVHWS